MLCSRYGNNCCVSMLHKESWRRHPMHVQLLQRRLQGRLQASLLVVLPEAVPAVAMQAYVEWCVLNSIA